MYSFIYYRNLCLQIKYSFLNEHFENSIYTAIMHRLVGSLLVTNCSMYINLLYALVAG